MKILLISDLHIGKSARCVSLVPEEDRAGESHIDDDYLNRFVGFIRQFSGDVDYLIIAGDMVDNGNDFQFLHFDFIMEKIVEALSIDIHRIFFTAGNHDTDRSVFEGVAGDELTGGLIDSRYDALRKSKMLTEILSNADGNLLKHPFYCSWQDNNLCVVSINTCCKDYKKDNTGISCGEISKEIIDSFEEYLSKTLNSEDNRIKILLLHHHPLNYSNLTSQKNDYSALQCYKDVVDISSIYGIDCIVHGHKHKPQFRSGLNESGIQITIICSGSFSKMLPTYAYDNYSNSIHLIDITHRDSETGVVCGNVYNYSYSHRNGWKPSVKSSDGIGERSPFGPNFHIRTVHLKLKNLLKEQIKIKSTIQFSYILNNIDEIKYMDENKVFELLNKVCEEINCENYGTSLNRCVIIKKEC